MTPGVKFSTSTSHLAASFRRISRLFGCLKSSARLFLEWFCWKKYVLCEVSLYSARARLQALKARSVAERRQFDLDDVGAGFGQKPGAGRTRDKLGDISTR